MSYFKAKCAEFDPAGGAYIAPLAPLAEFNGPTSKGKEEREKEGKEKRGKRGGKCSGIRVTIRPGFPDTSSFWPLSGRPGGFSKIGGLSGFLAQSASRPTFERYQLQRRTTAWDK